MPARTLEAGWNSTGNEVSRQFLLWERKQSSRVHSRLKRQLRTWLIGFSVLACLPWGMKESLAQPLPKLTEIRVKSTADGTLQPSLISVPPQAEQKPLPMMVFLHSWSSDYRQDNSKWFQEAAQRGWIYLHPNFRGRNNTPQGCGSELAQQDILDAIDYMIDSYSVDTSRIYLAGVSGGGHMTMLMAGKYPERFSAATAWVGISDLKAWYEFHTRTGTPSRYAQEIAKSCGGIPGSSPEVDEQYRNRSPMTFMKGVGDLPLDLNAGVYDGHTGSVPIAHSLRAFNEIARVKGVNEISEEEIEQLWTKQQLIHPRKEDVQADPAYGRDILLRRHAGPTRITIFDGTHESIPEPACEWLEKQTRETSAPNRE